MDTGYIIAVSYYNDLYPESPNIEFAYISDDKIENLKFFKANRDPNLNILNNITLNNGYWFPKDENYIYIHSCSEKGRFIYNYKPTDYSLDYKRYEKKDYNDSLNFNSAIRFTYLNNHKHYNVFVWKIKSKFCLCKDYPAMPRQEMKTENAIIFKQFELNGNIQENDINRFDVFFKTIIYAPVERKVSK